MHHSTTGRLDLQPRSRRTDDAQRIQLEHVVADELEMFRLFPRKPQSATEAVADRSRFISAPAAIQADSRLLLITEAADGEMMCHPLALNAPRPTRSAPQTECRQSLALRADLHAV